MSDDLGYDPTAPPDVEIVGPFEEHRLVINGWQVPYIKATPKGEIVSLTLDHRFGIDLPADREDILVFLANAIAVASGFSCHPVAPEIEPYPRRFYTRMTGLGSVPGHHDIEDWPVGKGPSAP